MKWLLSEHHPQKPLLCARETQPILSRAEGKCLVTILALVFPSGPTTAGNSVNLIFNIYPKSKPHSPPHLFGSTAIPSCLPCLPQSLFGCLDLLLSILNRAVTGILLQRMLSPISALLKSFQVPAFAARPHGLHTMGSAPPPRSLLPGPRGGHR